MMRIQSELPSVLVDTIGWTLIHFVWQGLLLAAMLQIILPLCRSAVARHNWAIATLAVMCFSPVATFFWLRGQGDISIAFVPDAGLRGIDKVLSGFEPASIPVSWAGWLVSLWLAGVAVLSLRALGGLILSQRLRQNGLALSDDLLQRCRRLQHQLGMTRPVQFLQMGLVRSPVTVGWFRPAILIPISAVTGLAPQQLEALILHELAHIRRLDAFTNVALVMAETILFYHPAIWWVNRRIRMEREHCCDDFAVSSCGDAAVYVEALTSLAVKKGAPAFALPANDGSLKNRVARLLNVSSDRVRFSLAAIVGLVFLSLAVGTVALAQTNTQPSLTIIQTMRPDFAIRVVDETVGKDALRDHKGDDLVRVAMPSNDMHASLWLKRESQIDGNELAEAHAIIGRDGKPAIEFRLTTAGRDQFSELTGDNVGHRLAIVVNGAVITAPTVRGAIRGGRGEITGDFKNNAEASKLASKMMGTNHS